MKLKILASTLTLLSLALPAYPAGKSNQAEDDASQGAYSSGWKGGDNGGSGFGPWSMQVQQQPGVESHAGFFIADVQGNPDLKGAAIKGKAFGMFANGISFEVASAFRPFEAPLAVGASFSFLFQNNEFVKKFDSDESGIQSIGLVLRSGNESATTDDYNKNARFEFGYYSGSTTYQIYDGSDDHDTGVGFTDAGLTVTITLTSPDTYDLEITNMGDKKVTKLTGRKLGGAAGSPIESFCLFDRNGEKYDSFFNGFQVTKPDNL